jgi:hypothetical protein
MCWFGFDFHLKSGRSLWPEGCRARYVVLVVLRPHIVDRLFAAAHRSGRLPAVEPQVLVSLASAAVAAVAILASSITTLLSLRTQRENTQATLDAQERISTAQEQALRERSHAQDLRDKRVDPYISLIKWADRLLEALDEMNEDSNPYLSLQDWNIAPNIDNYLIFTRRILCMYVTLHFAVN